MLDFIATANEAVVDAIIPDADVAIDNVYSTDYSRMDKGRRLKRKRDRLTRQVEASLKRGSQQYILNRWKKIERDIRSNLMKGH